MENKEYNLEKEVKGLNENHLRVISCTLRLIEKDIDEIEWYIKNTPQGRMYEIIDDLTEEQKEKILKIINSLKDCINEFANMLKIKPDKVSICGMVRGTLSTHWTNVCDIETQKLKAYGMVDQDIGEILNLYNRKLIDLLKDFYR